IYTLLFHIPLLIAVYINLQLVHTFFVKGRYILYLASISFLLFFCVSFYFFLFRTLVPLILKNYYFIAYYTPWQIAQFISAYILLSLLFHLSVGWFLLRDKEFQLQKENHLVQLKNLKEQINPHFLFNSLNNIYSLAGRENMEVRNYLTKLSDALRYMIYETDVELVPLKNEVEYLLNYFELEKLRLEKSNDVVFSCSGDLDQYLIAPLLLLPLVENCFRHCDPKAPNIKIDLSVQDDRLTFVSENSRPVDKDKKPGGVGLNNVKKRLALIYGTAGSLRINEQEDRYKLYLQINLQQE
ncbi:MAG: sensor histidine kinase, partial [Saprospiraceae bacterium]|nr:sensor histidine kinase [Saprospiraceae bacterium]